MIDYVPKFGMHVMLYMELMIKYIYIEIEGWNGGVYFGDLLPRNISYKHQVSIFVCIYRNIF